jgi:hypothetical protein
MLEIVARKLGKLNNDVVYLGGCATALFITDPLSLDVRPTLDVDCIIDVVSLMQYQKFKCRQRVALLMMDTVFIMSALIPFALLLCMYARSSGRNPESK